MTDELLYNRLELVPGVDVKGMVIDPFSKDAWEIDIGEEYIGPLEGDIDFLQDVNMPITVD